MADRRQSLVEDLGVAMQRYQRSAQAFDDAVGRALGLGPADLRCLDWLADGPKSAGQLAAGVGLRPAAVTSLIDRLVRRGLVERTSSEADRRRVLVSMTPEGENAISPFYEPMVSEGQAMLGSLTERELILLREHLEAITDLTDRHRQRIES